MVKPRASLLVLLLVALGCGGAPPPARPTPTAPAVVAAVPEEPAPADTFPRYTIQPLPVPNAFRAAVAGGTRTPTGEAGPRYWQQKVDYRIEAELDPAAAVVRGSETVVYHNRSTRTLPELVLHLYQNLFAPGVMRNRDVPVTGGVALEAVTVAGVPAHMVGDTRRFSGASAGVRPSPGAGPDTAARAGAEPTYTRHGTLMRVRLPHPVVSGDSVQLDLDWSFAVPPAGAPRMGRIGHQLFAVAQWYPQVAVFDDLHGWDGWPYLGEGEFYLEYGDFDVSITVPEGWIVAATGTLENPDEVFPDPVRRRLAAALAADTVVHVLTEDDLGPGSATRQDPSGTLTWHFSAQDVRDFAFAASDRYLWDATGARVADADGNKQIIPIQALFRSEATDWRGAAEYTRHTIEFHSAHWHRFIYPQMTSVEAPVGGMEYPMIVFVRSIGSPEAVYRTIDHEVGHEWYPMMVGSDEHRFAWQDEGVNTYIEDRAAADFLGIDAVRAFAGDLSRYLSIAGEDAEVPMMRPADLYGPGRQRVIASYSKPAMVLRALEGVIGRDTLDRALREYSDRWLLRHPHALDFFDTVEAVAGRDLDWFWYPWFYTTGVLDQALAGVEMTSADTAGVMIEDRGDIPMPVHVLVTTASGARFRARIPVSVWLSGLRAYRASVAVDGPVVRVEIDPDTLYPDVNRSNNVWAAAAPPRARHRGGDGR